MWSVGCIAAELLTRRAFLPGTSDLDQLSKIFEALGSPTEENWPNVKSLPDYVEFRATPGFPLRDIFTAAGDDLIELLQGLFYLYPPRRLTASQALRKFNFCRIYFYQKLAHTQKSPLKIIVG